jgi:hypothetical protein
MGECNRPHYVTPALMKQAIMPISLKIITLHDKRECLVAIARHEVLKQSLAAVLRLVGSARHECLSC